MKTHESRVVTEKIGRSYLVMTDDGREEIGPIEYLWGMTCKP